MSKALSRIAAAAVLFAAAGGVLAGPGFPLQLAGTVAYVEDGDTLTILDDRRQQYNIRLTDLDAPERGKKRYNKPGQPFSAASTRELAGLAKGRPARAHCYEYDQNKRLVCRVHVDGKDLSLEQIRVGLAWANRASRRYVRDAQAYRLEDAARAAGRGLWTAADPIAPWIWRRMCWKDGQCAGAGT